MSRVAMLSYILKFANIQMTTIDVLMCQVRSFRFENIPVI